MVDDDASDDAQGDAAPTPTAAERAIRAAAEAGQWREAATATLTAYGEEILGYLVALTRDQVRADEAFSIFLENLWRGLPRFGWRSSMRTWAYVLARHAAHRQGRSPYHKRAQPLDPEIEALAAPLRTQTASYLQTEQRDRLAAIRAELAPDDQTLLILRVGRGLAWRDIAQVLAGGGDGDGEDSPDEAAPLPAPEVTRRAAALRKRFERLKSDLKARLASAPA